VLRALALLPVLAVMSLFSDGAFAYTCISAASVSQFSMQFPANITIPRDAAVGTVIATATSNIPSDGTVGVNCTASGSEQIPAVFTNYQGGNADGNGVNPIGNTGIGFRTISLETGSVYAAGPSYTKYLTNASFQPGPNTSCIAGLTCYIEMGPTVQMQLVKLQPLVGSPSIPAGKYLDVTVGGKTASTVSLASPVQINSGTCTVKTPAIAVDLGSVSSQKILTSVGTVSTAMPFDIVVDCTGLTSTLAITFTDATNSANRSNLLSLSSGSTASGVSIQILKNGAPVSFGPDSSVYQNTNQITIGPTNSSIVDLPLGGRYVRTGAITPGSANGSATFTMSYQ
jgi:type 1 fimbria pilin